MSTSFYKKYILFVVVSIVFSFISIASAQVQISGIEVPRYLEVNKGEKLELFGAGPRKILWIDVYWVAIYFNEKDYSSNELINSNQTMGLRLYMKSSLVSKSRIKSAIERGFNKSTDGNYHKYKTRMEQMIDSFEEEINKNDIIDLIYYPTGETYFYKNNQYLGIIQGFDFKQALYGIWLSQNCVDNSLKTDIMQGL
jgi:hypothetical protein